MTLRTFSLWQGVVLAMVSGPGRAAPPPDYDFDWAEIGSLNNKGYDRDDPFDQIVGRGSVPYGYRISKMETTTAQWVEYVNTFSTQSNDLSFFSVPMHWGGEADPTYSGPGVRWRPRAGWANAENVALGGVSWREAARYCNWLHNGKQATLESLETGAYDTSTWGYGPGRTFTDEERHLPGAKFWIPTVDEYLKAAFYDPVLDHWWLHPNATDDPTPNDQTSADDRNAGPERWMLFPLGMYPDTQSPWGLLDLSGGGSEWNEDWLYGEPIDRVARGSVLGQGPDGTLYSDPAYALSSGPPDVHWYYTIRLASAIPAPCSSAFVLGFAPLAWRRRRTA